MFKMYCSKCGNENIDSAIFCNSCGNQLSTKVRRLLTYFAYLIAASAGLALWIVIPMFTDNLEAWSTNLYYTIGIPTVMVVCLLLGYLVSKPWWHWGLSAYLSQAIFIIAMAPTSNLMPPALFVLAIFCIPYFLGGFLGALLKKRSDKKRKTTGCIHETSRLLVKN